MTMTTQQLETGWFPETPTEDNLLRRFLHHQAHVPGVPAERQRVHELRERVAVDGYPVAAALGAAPNSIYAESTLQSPLLVRIGRVDGAPVSVAASFLAYDVVNLCLAATLPAGRRRGVWAQLVADRVNDE